jgi:Flp pilus assembly protein TadD
MSGGAVRRAPQPKGLLRTALLAFVVSGPAAAVDTPPSTALPDLSAIRAEIYGGNHVEAIRELTALTATVKHADLYNLLGYSLRSLGRYEEARRWYAEALYYDPAHRPALEYQGELFIALGDLTAARGNVQMLRLLCAKGCAELDALQQAVAAAEARTAAR